MSEGRFKFPRVSEILSACRASFELEKINPETLANAGDRGTKVHEYATAYMLGDWIPNIEEECKPYFDSFVSWYEKEVEKVHIACTRFEDPKRKYTGEVDMFVSLKSGEYALVDLKTSCKPSKSWPIQLAAYAVLLKLNTNFKDFSLLNLHLKKTGKEAKVIPQEEFSQSWGIFSSCLDVFDYFHREEWEKGGENV